MAEDIRRILDDVGESITIRDVTVSVDDYGHSYESTTNYTVTAVVTIMNGESDEVREGILAVGDIIIYVDPDDTNANYIKLNNRIVYNNAEYKIVNVIKEKGVERGESFSVIEAHGKRII